MLANAIYKTFIFGVVHSTGRGTGYHKNNYIYHMIKINNEAKLLLKYCKQVQLPKDNLLSLIWNCFIHSFSFTKFRLVWYKAMNVGYPVWIDTITLISGLQNSFVNQYSMWCILPITKINNHSWVIKLNYELTNSNLNYCKVCTNVHIWILFKLITIFHNSISDLWRA